ncbi:hypothetical protein [Botrimarina hoheduenensis]|uniref:Uncharacterized protein n=1 Tax=Botrimarina hoheduenensis TaxID=2528000 RepID=A0A5C5VX98_9BACT|nr:hypothetical protein [Botrimarina hoheduenensis]TWT43258.1 hypothetical protein Pla111_22080 [Botrimarina hoheduenensis]
MSQKPSLTPLFSQVDVTTSSAPHSTAPAGADQANLLREVLSAQDRTNELLEEMVGLLTAQHRQRNAELNRWRRANPALADNCRQAAEALSEVQVDFLERLTEDVVDNHQEMAYGDFMLSEFVDRYGPRLAHLNGVIQALAQLGGGSAPAQDASEEG